MRAFVALTCLAIMAPVLAAGVYTWRDKEGKVHYSDVPPAGDTQSRSFKAASTPASAGEARSHIANQDLEFRKRREEAGEARAKAEKESKDAEERKTNCTQARNQLAALTSGQRLTRFNAAGEREYLDDAQRAQETERANKAVADWCK